MTITASPTSSENDFDFLLGNWNVHNKKLKERLNNSNDWEEFSSQLLDVKKILAGYGNVDRFIADKFEATTLRIFNRQSKLWSLYWADSIRTYLDIPMIGSFNKDVGEFFCEDIFNNTPITVRFIWKDVFSEKPLWEQAFSTDNGNTWETNWIMMFERKKNDLD